MFLFVVVLFTLTKITTADSIQDHIERLNIEDQEKLLHQLQNAAASKRDTSKIDVAENWCCRTDPGIQAVRQTRQYTYYVRKIQRFRLFVFHSKFLSIKLLGDTTQSTQMRLSIMRFSRLGLLYKVVFRNMG